MPYPDDVCTILRGSGTILIFASDGSGPGKVKLLRTAEKMVADQIIDRREYLLLAERLFAPEQPKPGNEVKP